MKIRKFIPILILFTILACSRDDHRNTDEDLRDEDEVWAENQNQIEDFLESHSFRVKDNSENSDFQTIVFDTLSGNHKDDQPIMESDSLDKKTIQFSEESQEYTVYYLKIKNGADQKYQPTFADKVVITYQMQNFKGNTLSESNNPHSYDLPQTNSVAITRGAIAGITEVKGASDFKENSDGTLTFNDDYGLGAVFIPSGLGYFNNTPSPDLEPYKPFIMTFQLYDAIQMDHDRDGIPSYLEDVNGNKNLNDDDTDKDGTPNYLDDDDDGDGIPTRQEIEIDMPADSIITKDDINFFPNSEEESDTPDYLNPEI